VGGGGRRGSRQTLRARRSVRAEENEIIWGIPLAYDLVRLEMARIAAEADVEPTRISFVESLRLIRNEWEWLTVTSAGAVPNRLETMRRNIKRSSVCAWRYLSAGVARAQSVCSDFARWSPTARRTDESLHRATLACSGAESAAIGQTGDCLAQATLLACRCARYVREGGRAMRLLLRRRQALSGAEAYRIRSREAVCQTRLGQNIRLLCRWHNLLHARKCFGSLHISAKLPPEGAPSRRLEREDDQGQRHRRVDERFSARGRFAASRLHFCLSQSDRERAGRCHWVRISARCPKRFCPSNVRLQKANRSARTAFTERQTLRAAKG